MTRDCGNLPDGVTDDDIDPPLTRPKYVRVRVDVRGTGTITILNLRGNGSPAEVVERMNRAHMLELLDDTLRLTEVEFVSVEDVPSPANMDTD